MRYLSVLLVLAHCHLRADIGSIRWVNVQTNGFMADVCVEGFNTNGTFEPFLTTNVFGVVEPTANTPYLEFRSMGFSFPDGAYKTYAAERAYLTDLVRKIYPGQTTNQIVHEGTNAIFTVALSRPVFALDSNATFTAFSGNFATTNVATNSLAASGLSAVTNLSAQQYGFTKAIANWAWVHWLDATGTTVRVEVVGFHWSARDGQPLARLEISCTDESGDAVTNAAVWTTDFWVPDPWATGRYFTTFQLSSFTEFDQLRFDFRAVPFIGDTNSILDTTRNLYGYPRPSSVTNLCNPNATYNPYRAAVEPVGGSDANGRATNVTDWTQIRQDHYFKTPAAMWSAIAGTNNLVNSRNTAGAGIGFIITTNTTNFEWSGGTISAGAASLAEAWAITMTAPGLPQAVITNRNSDRNVGHRTAFRNVSVATSDPAVPFFSGGALWFDQCRFDTPGTALIQSMTNVFLTHCAVTNMEQGLRAIASQNTAFGLLRGNNLDGLRDEMVFYTAISNFRPNTNRAGFLVNDYNTAIGAPTPEFGILYNNWFGGFADGNPAVSFGGACVITNGMAIVQNTFIKGSAAGAPLMGLFSSGNNPSTNILFWHNTVLGERIADVFSSASETATIWRNHISIKNNIIDLSGFKDDYEASAEDADRFGNRGVFYQTGCSGNMFVECRVNAAAGGFPTDFVGLYSHNPRSGGSTNIIAYARFVDRQAYDGSGTAAAGGGNYAMQSHSPGFGHTCEWLLPTDRRGLWRGRGDPPGAEASGNVGKGGFF
jgi:hypothetical protein